MEFFGSLIELIYRVGTTVLFGNSSDNAVPRIALIAIVIGMIGFLPLSIAVILWAAYVCFFSFWNPSLREISGFHFKMTALLILLLSAIWMTKDLLA